MIFLGNCFIMMLISTWSQIFEGSVVGFFPDIIPLIYITTAHRMMSVRLLLSECIPSSEGSYTLYTNREHLLVCTHDFSKTWGLLKYAISISLRIPLVPSTSSTHHTVHLVLGPHTMQFKCFGQELDLWVPAQSSSSWSAVWDGS